MLSAILILSPLNFKGSSFDTISILKNIDIQIESTSSINKMYNFKFDDEMLHKSYDAQKETIKQKLERFNNQKAK